MSAATIEATLLDHPVEGRHLAPGTLADQLGDRPTLLIFLRHLGCIFCRECIGDVRKAAAADPSFPPTLFIHMGGVADGDTFFEAHYPEARAIADPGMRLSDGLEVPRGTIGQFLGPEVWACGMKATLKGHGIGKPVGDVRKMPAFVAVDRSGRVTWRYVPRHAADHPDFARVADLVNSAASS